MVLVTAAGVNAVAWAAGPRSVNNEVVDEDIHAVGEYRRGP